MKIALVHDWLTGMRGGERVLDVFLQIYPDADIYTLLHAWGSTNTRIDSRVKGTSILQKIPGAEENYRKFLPLYPIFARTIKISGYDLVISLSHAAAKNVIVDSGIPHICYCFTPMRYIWDQSPAYLGSMVKPLYPLIKLLRIWDVTGARRVRHFASISGLVSARIRLFYKRKSRIIYPPVELSRFSIGASNSQRTTSPFLYAGALVPYKRIDVIIRACNRLSLPLVVAGTGGQRKYLESIAGNTIKFVGKVSDDELISLYQSSRALLFAGKEDFGIVPVEAQACGCPVIGFNWGGLRETVVPISTESNNIDQREPSGILWKVNRSHPLDELFCDAINAFIENESRFKPDNCVNSARRFSRDVFINSWNSYIDSKI